MWNCVGPEGNSRIAKLKVYLYIIIHHFHVFRSIEILAFKMSISHNIHRPFHIITEYTYRTSMIKKKS